MSMNETYLRRCYAASFREAVEDVNKLGTKKGRKRMIEQNTLANYEECKRNPKMASFLMKKHGL